VAAELQVDDVPCDVQYGERLGFRTGPVGIGLPCLEHAVIGVAFGRDVTLKERKRALVYLAIYDVGLGIRVPSIISGVEYDPRADSPGLDVSLYGDYPANVQCPIGFAIVSGPLEPEVDVEVV